jgi:hypothetical protein
MKIKIHFFFEDANLRATQSAATAPSGFFFIQEDSSGTEYGSFLQELAI